MTVTEAWFDGVCEPRNPGGHGAFGILVKDDSVTVEARGEYLGINPAMSNNVAEYAGVCAVLTSLLDRGTRRLANCSVVIRGDSKLVICQLDGTWKVHGGFYVPLYHKAKAMLDVLRERCEGRVYFEWIPRDRNGECDYWSKQVLRDRGIVLRIQPDTVVLRET